MSAYHFKYFQNNPIQKSRDRSNPPDLPTLKAYPTPGVGGRFGFFSLKWRERMNLKVPGAILPLGCAILSTRAKTVNPPLGELGLNTYTFVYGYKIIKLIKCWNQMCNSLGYVASGATHLATLRQETPSGLWLVTWQKVEKISDHLMPCVRQLEAKTPFLLRAGRSLIPRWLSKRLSLEPPSFLV